MVPVRCGTAAAPLRARVTTSARAEPLAIPRASRRCGAPAAILAYRSTPARRTQQPRLARTVPKTATDPKETAEGSAEADELSEEAALAAYVDAALVETDEVVALEQQQQQQRTTAVDLQSLPGVPQVQWPERDPELPPILEMPPPVKTAQSLLGEIFKEENVESYLNAVDRLSTMVAETATETREALQEASEVGMHNTVETALTLIFGMETTVESYAVYARGGLLLNGIVAGDNMLIRKMLIRSSNLPMLAAVVQSWKGKNRKGAPLHLDRLRIQGMQVHNLRGSSLKYLHQMFAEFPSTLSIHHLELVHTELVIAPTGWGDTRSGGRTVQAPSVMMARFECNDVWNTMSPALMLACCSNLQEPQTVVSTYAMTAGDAQKRQRSLQPPRRRPTGRKSKDQRQAEDGTLDAIATSEHEPFQWRQEWRRDKLQGAYEMFAGLVDLMPLPIPDEDRPKMLRYEQMERLGTAFVDEMPRLLSATGAVTTSGKLSSDAAIAVEVVKAGVPMSMLDKQGDLFVRMVDTGVAAAVLERGNLTREMARRGVLAPLIEAGLLDVALQHPELVVEMIEQGIFDAVVCSGTLEEVVKKQNVNFLKQLLSGHMLAELTYSRVLADMISQYSEKKL